MAIEKRVTLIAAVSVLFILICFAVRFVSQYDKYEIEVLFDDGKYSLDSGWTVIENGKEVVSETTLPVNIPYNDSGVFTLTAKLDENYEIREKPAVLFLKMKYAGLNAYLDGELIYSFMSNNERLAVTSYAFIPLPDDFGGRQLSLDFYMKLGDSIEYNVQTITLGAKSQILFDTISGDIVTLMFAVIIFAIGVILIILRFMSIKGVEKSNSLIFTGLIAIDFSLYAAVQTSSINISFTNNYLLHTSEMMLLAFLCIPVSLLIRKNTDKKYYRICTVALILNMANIIAQILAYSMSGIELRTMLTVTHLAIGVSAVLLVTSILLTLLWTKSSSKEFMISICPMVLGGILDLSRFYSSNFGTTSFWLKLGISCFILLQFIYISKSYFSMHKAYIEAEMYRKMAYIDAMTGLQNRSSYEHDVIELQNTVHRYDSLWCISIDLNNLKQMNDVHGHLAGDEIIKGMAKILLSTVDKDCRAYRMGGDEFLLLVTNRPDEAIEKIKKKITESMHAFNEASHYKLSFAVGADKYSLQSDSDIKQCLSRADAKMYENKVLIKSGNSPR